MTDTSIGTARAAFGARVSAPFLRTFRNYAVLYVLGITTFLLAFPASRITGTEPDFEVVIVFAYFVAVALAIIVGSVLGWKLGRMILIEKPDSASRAMLAWIARSLDEDCVPNTLHMLISMSFFMVGFAVLKGAIAILNPFEWDQVFHGWDRALHFGSLPHEFLVGLSANHTFMAAINLVYNAWYVVMISCLLIAGVNGRGVHMQYLVSFVLTWLIGGFFLAIVFSSAGPAFYELAGFGDQYASLMNKLYEMAETTPLPALSTQELLWDGYSGERDGSTGISAFPSVHVATAALIAIYASCVNRVLAVAAWAFLAAIMLGSVILGWHYAIDGYAGLALAFVFWKMAGVLTTFSSEKITR